MGTRQALLSSAMTLRVRGVHKRFGRLEVLRGIDLEVSRGEILSLVGENGTGKSTIVHCIAGTWLPDRGTVELDGRPLGAADRDQGVAVVWQDLALCDNLERRRQPLPRRRAARRLRPRRPADVRRGGGPASTRCDLDSRRSRPAGRRRSRAASASSSPSPGPCCAGPDLLVLDEPTAVARRQRDRSWSSGCWPSCGRRGPRSCSCRTGSTRSSTWPTASWCCATAASSPTCRRSRSIPTTSSP